MCLLIAILLFFGGFFGISNVFTSSSVSTAEPVLVEPPPLKLTPTPTAAVQATSEACVTVSVEDDEADMLALVEGVFEAPTWTMQSYSSEMSSRVVFQTEAFDKLADVQFVHYDCGDSEGQLDFLTAPAQLDQLLTSYNSYTYITTCGVGDIRLVEMSATFGDKDYAMRYWVEQISPTRLLSLNLVFEEGEEAEQEQYAQDLFPELPNCDAA